MFRFSISQIICNSAYFKFVYGEICNNNRPAARPHEIKRIDCKRCGKSARNPVGYRILPTYLFPFEKSYPELRNRTHEYVEGASFEDAVNLYYFDFDLRLLLMRYLNRIEIAFRTSLIYNLSNKYNTNPVWFVSPVVVNRPYACEFERKVYTS